MTIVHIVLILLNREGADTFTLQLVYFIYIIVLSVAL